MARGKIAEALLGGNRLLALYECPYCRSENSYEVPRNSSSGEILKHSRNCENCGMVMMKDDFIEFETIG